MAQTPSPADPAEAAIGTDGSSRRTQLTNSDIIRFYIPLAATTMGYAIVFNVMNSAMARTAEAAAALAAFSVGQSIADLLATPAGAGNNWLLARGRDRRSFGAGLKVMYQIIGIVLALLALAGWTGFGAWLYAGVFNAPAHLSEGIVVAIRVCIMLPFIFTLRGASQSVLMLRRKTHLMTAGVVVRFTYIVIASAILPRVLRMHGGGIGALLWASGMGVEAIFDFLMARRAFRELPEVPEDGAEPPPAAAIWTFLLPLIASSLLWAMGKPMLNLGMARSTDPETAIAAYQVAWNAAWLLLAYVQGGFRQAVVVFWNDEHSLRTLRSFATKLAVAITAVMVALTLSGATSWFLREVVGAEEKLIAPSRAVVLVLAFMPLALVATEVGVGRLLRNGNTAAIGLAKGANVAAIAITVFVLAAAAPGLGALIGGLGMLGGASAEFVVLHLATRRMMRTPTGSRRTPAGR